MIDDFNITVSNSQRSKDEKENFEVITTGTMKLRNGKRYILYKVYDDEASAGDYTTVKIDKTSENTIVTVMRNNDKSDDHINLILEEGKRHLCEYSTPVGNLYLGISTSSVVDEIDENGGTLKLRYKIDVEGETTSHNAVDITLNKIEQGE